MKWGKIAAGSFLPILIIGVFGSSTYDAIVNDQGLYSIV